MLQPLWLMLLPVTILCIGWCYCHVFVVDLITTYNNKADVIACCNLFIIGWCYANVYVADVMSTYCNIRRYCMADVIVNMSVADFITTGADVIAPLFWLMLLPMCGRWYSHFGVMWWLMLLPSGRWNGHCRVGGNMLADVIANWQMLLPRVIIVLI